jgi:hypothetical protein
MAGFRSLSKVPVPINRYQVFQLRQGGHFHLIDFVYRTIKTIDFSN